MTPKVTIFDTPKEGTLICLTSMPVPYATVSMTVKEWGEVKSSVDSALLLKNSQKDRVVQVTHGEVKP